jgi:hypothetical protein
MWMTSSGDPFCRYRPEALHHDERRYRPEALHHDESRRCHLHLGVFHPGGSLENELAAGSGAAAYLCLVDGCSKSLGWSLGAESRAVTGRPVVPERGSACSGD